jgi:hypothetical protein
LDYDDFIGAESNPDDDNREEHNIRINQVALPDKYASTNIDLYLNFIKYVDRIGLKVTYKDELFDLESIHTFIQGYFDMFQKI